ncbi:MAG: hypothetical protein KAQ65_03690 [Candidatus Thorarchaeota archaeon]|nr:hypothetical protein [Candidatus Thorarchaeota archaeon]
MKTLQDCTPFCESFLCTLNRGSLKIRTRGGKKQAWCTSHEDTCDGGWCQYSRCEIRKLSDGNKCKREDKPRTSTPKKKDEPWVDPSRIPPEYEKKLRSKMKS